MIKKYKNILKFLIAVFAFMGLLYILIAAAFFLNNLLCYLLWGTLDEVGEFGQLGLKESILVVAIFVAAFAMYLNRKNTSEKAALDVLYRFDQDDKIVRAKKIYGAVMRGELSLNEIFPGLMDDCSICHVEHHSKSAVVIDDEKMTVREVYDSIMYLLNYMEEMALGVRVGIYNYKIILGARRKNIMKIYFAFEDFIETGIRKGKVKMYSSASKDVLSKISAEENKYGIDESSNEMRAKLYEHFEWLVKERLAKDGKRKNVVYTDFPFFYEL